MRTCLVIKGFKEDQSPIYCCRTEVQKERMTIELPTRKLRMFDVYMCETCIDELKGAQSK